jgi:phage terminase large subunit
MRFFFERTNYTLTISRKSFPALRGSVMRDIFDIMKEWGLYKEDNHKKTVNEYHLPERGNLIEFVSADEPQKMRGRKRTDLWLNEANEFSYEDFFQFNMRTTGQVYIDFNPSDSFHWIYDKLLTKPENECTFIHSTYKDNPFLAKEIVREIEALKDIDPEYWKIYGLGERGNVSGLIFTNWAELHEDFEPTHYGLDFGFNHPTALIGIQVKDPEIYVKEIVYARYLTVGDLAERMKEFGMYGKTIIADSARPEMIEDLNRLGFYVRATPKGAGSVKHGIDLMKRYKMRVHRDSSNIIKELKSYKWIEKAGVQTDEPIKLNNDGIDALRYACTDALTKSDFWVL